MDSNEATRIVFSRIQKIDPDNASKIMGFLLIQDHGEKEMIRISFGPEALIHTVILRARKELGLSPTTPLPKSPNTPLSCQNSLSSSSRFGFSNNANANAAAASLATPTHPFSGGASTTSWNSSVFVDFHNPEHILSPCSSNGGGNFNSSLTSFCGDRGGDVIDDFQLNDHLSFLNETSPSLGLTNSEELSSPQELFASNLTNDQTLPHKRSFSVSDIGLGSDYDPISGDELGWKPCLYFSKGFCKNGTSCGYPHGGGYDPSMLSSSDGSEHLVGSPNRFEMMEHCQELLRSRSLQHQHRLATASQLMASSSFPFSGSKTMNNLLQLQQQNEGPRSRLEKNHFLLNGGLDMVNPNSRQIYLTFPADSTFREEDVSNYFSIYGPVQDVRIPYQQKRMFGFVTFVYSETVKIILAKGNPHFVCDSRVLVKPYKEKGRIPDKFRKQPQPLERGEYSACSSPTALDARDPFDIHLGPRMFYDQDLLWRRKQLEEQDLHQALELQSRRLMSLQLLDVKKQHYNHHRAFSTGGLSGSSPTHSPRFFNLNFVSPLDHRTPGSSEEKCCSPPKAISTDASAGQMVISEAIVEKENSGSFSSKASAPIAKKDANLPESLPDSPFASATKEVDFPIAFSNGANEVGKNAECSGVPAPTSTNNIAIATTLFPTTSTIGISSFSSCYFQAAGISSSSGAIEM